MSHSIKAALCHGIGKRLDDGTRDMISWKNSSEIIPVLDAQFLDGARAAIQELMLILKVLQRKATKSVLTLNFLAIPHVTHVVEVEHRSSP